MKLLVSFLASVALAAALPHSARPCGMFVPATVASNPAIAAQRALVIVRANTIELHLQPHAAGDGAAFAWIIPVPAVPTVSLGDAAVFSALDQLTTPHVTLTQKDSGGGIGCGSADAGGGLRNVDDGIQHFGGGTLGDYTYDTIQGNTAEAVETWLTDNGYVLPDGFATTIAPYVGHPFVAVKLAAGASEADLQPLVIRYERGFDTSVGYALGLSRASTTDVAPVLIWVLADKRYRVANYASAELKTLAEVMREQADSGAEADYQAAVTQVTAESSGRIAFTEFARELDADADPALSALRDADAHYLTRLYMEVPKAEIEDLVITFAANAPDVSPTQTAAAPHEAPMTAACIGLAVVALGLLRRRAR